MDRLAGTIGAQAGEGRDNAVRPNTGNGAGSADGGLAAQYAPGQKRPLAGYAGLAAVYGGAVTAGIAALRRRGRQLPEHPQAGDIALVAVATHKLSRIIAKDKVTGFVRAPFTRYQWSSGAGEVEEEARGHGLQLAEGELLVCPYCLSQWVATGLTLGLIANPRATRMACAVFASYTLSDFLQVAYRAAEDAA